jgi:hypothetical protein
LNESILKPSFVRILAAEVGTNADPQAIGAAVVRTCERISRLIAPLIGERASEALLIRSLRLTEEQFPRQTAPARSAVDGSLSTRVEIVLAQQAPGAVRDFAVAMLVTFSELLASFAGDSVLMRLMREAWPDFVVEDGGTLNSER